MKGLIISSVLVGVVVLTACSGQSEATVGQYTAVEYEAVYDAGTVAKGEIVRAKMAYINAEVDTDKTGKGIINKPITITANTRPSTTKVTIKATVID